MKTYKEFAEQVGDFKDQETLLKTLGLKSVPPKKQLKVVGNTEPEYDPQAEKAQGDLYASLVKELQDLLDTLDWDESNVVGIQQALAKINHQGQAYLKHISSK
ncbi:MAG: hypothetical protein M0R80_03045 [Proteobacteria bacterium]|jgi:hypothetical protein|nr:hypothetical protein [Pseudomonadota bacterium]